jgi:hypothetical protein
MNETTVPVSSDLKMCYATNPLRVNPDLHKYPQAALPQFKKKQHYWD